MNQADQEQAERRRILARYFSVSSIRGDNRPLAKRFLLGALWAAVLTPLLFYLKFGTVGWFAIGFTVFLVMLCLLFAFGFFFQTKRAYQSPVPMRHSIADRIGAFWLVACAFGPFLGWLITVFGVNENSWKWQYLARAFLAVILPVITAVPLVPYARAKSALFALPLLLMVTALPVTSCLWVLADLHDGPVRIQMDHVGQDVIVWASSDGQRYDRIMDEAMNDLPPDHRAKVVWLKHTDRVLAIKVAPR
jgi:hypothetical protein